jgi:hypothetical protein
MKCSKCLAHYSANNEHICDGLMRYLVQMGEEIKRHPMKKSPTTRRVITPKLPKKIIRRGRVKSSLDEVIKVLADDVTELRDKVNQIIDFLHQKRSDNPDTP